MAKKSTAARQSNAARRPQTPAKAAGVTLVRTPKATEPGNSGTDTEARTATASPAASAEKPRAAASATLPRPRVQEAPRPAPKPAPKPEPAPQSKAPQNHAQAARVARARATQRARIANMITPEHYSYVLNDLKLIAALAVSMFAVIIVLHFVLG